MSSPLSRQRRPAAGTPRPARATRARQGLTRERIVAAAVELVEASGPDALTMRAVADRLDTGAMSLYRHVANRDALLDLVVASMMDDVHVTPATGDWRADLRALAIDMRQALLRRPRLTVLLTERAGRGGGGLPVLDRALRIFRAAGFSPREAALANHAFGNYVAGAALWQAVGLEGATGEERIARADAAAAGLRSLPPETFPDVAWAAADLFAGTADERFEYGLACLVDGFAHRLEAASTG
jgi:TetR/AcrR family tetracycline transcriptional repressor